MVVRTKQHLVEIVVNTKDFPLKLYRL